MCKTCVHELVRAKKKSYDFALGIVKSTTEQQLEDNVNELANMDDEYAKKLISKGLKHWGKAFFEVKSKCDIVDNNLSEAFNSTIMEARHKSIITMLEEIKVKMMKRIVEKR